MRFWKSGFRKFSGLRKGPPGIIRYHLRLIKLNRTYRDHLSSTQLSELIKAHRCSLRISLAHYRVNWESVDYSGLIKNGDFESHDFDFMPPVLRKFFMILKIRDFDFMPRDFINSLGFNKANRLSSGLFRDYSTLPGFIRDHLASKNSLSSLRLIRVSNSIEWKKLYFFKFYFFFVF